MKMWQIVVVESCKSVLIFRLTTDDHAALVPVMKIDRQADPKPEGPFTAGIYMRPDLGMELCCQWYNPAVLVRHG